MTRVGILALQGDVPEHLAAAARVVGERNVVAVRGPTDLEGVDALFLPGGESTAIERLMSEAGVTPVLRRRLEEGLPVLATCAGLILVAKHLEPSPTGRDPSPLGALDVTVRRNDYGRQRESFEGPVDVRGLRGPPFPGVFIRAPRILSLGAGAEAIAYRGEEVVGARSGPVWGLTFHPELSGDSRLHETFLRETLGRAGGQSTKAKSTKTATTRPAPMRAATQ
jgi:5'-phosphate synthase pdxT subunit